MSCQPGSPCYNNDTNCTGDPCNPNNAVSCATVIYNGPNLPATGIDTCTNLCTALQEIDNTISEIVTGSNITASNGLTKVGDDIRLGGALTQSTTIATGIYDLILTGIDTGASTDQLLVLTPGGVVKKVAASSLAPTITLTANTGLAWNNAPTNSELKTLYNTTKPDSAQSVPLGGAPSHPASYWKTKTFVEMFDEILFPTQYPTYKVPQLELTGLTSGTYEVGASLSVSLTAVGSAWDGGAITTITYSKSVNGGAATLTPHTSGFSNGTSVDFGTEFSFLDPNSPNIPKSAPSLSQSLTIPPPASGNSSTVVYGSSMVYGNGASKKTSLNANDTRTAILPPYASSTISTGPIGGGTITGPSITLTGIYPIFYGYIDNPLGTAIVTNASISADITAGLTTGPRKSFKSLVAGDVTITIAFGNQSDKTFWIAVPTSYTAKTTFKLVWIGYARPFGSNEAWNDFGTVNVDSPGPAVWNGISYRIYRTNQSTSTTGSIQIY